LLRQSSLPFAAVRPCTTARTLDPRRTRSVNGTPCAGCEPRSTLAVATTWPPTIFVPTPASRSGGFVTVIDADAETPPEVAVSFTEPVRVPAVNSVDAGVVWDRPPSRLDESVHVAAGKTALPYASKPVAVNVCDALARTLAVTGESASRAAGAATTVSICATVPAVSVGVPASVSV